MNDGQFYAENIKSEEVNVLFFHNTLPEYRIGWFEALSERVNVEFVFTNEKIMGLRSSMKGQKS